MEYPKEAMEINVRKSCRRGSTVGDMAGFGVGIAMEQVKQEQALELVERQTDAIVVADIYAKYDCSANDVHFDTAENREHTLYAYGGEKMEEKSVKVNATKIAKDLKKTKYIFFKMNVDILL